ncbi:hypothetical protein TFLX_00375 [Thermoflexales bacterium]|nr:hypothetical protein TFLX_00375 [Thermoflexales bacterium]
MSRKIESFLWLILGAGLLVFMGWRWNVPAAVWLAPIFLIRFFRLQERWVTTLWAVPLMTLALFINITGSWDFPLAAEVGIAMLRAAPLLAALYLDRTLVRRLPPVFGTLIYPAIYVIMDFALSLTPLGTVFSAATTQFGHTAFIQLAAITGIWGLAFVMGWCAATLNLLWEKKFEIRQVTGPGLVLIVTLTVTLLIGGLRLSTSAAPTSTVKVAGITVPHQRDYWGEIIDRGTPPDAVQRYAAELVAVEDQLFARSTQAAQAGAKIVFWSEANALLSPEQVDDFLARAQAFAKEYQVYFMPAFVIFQYDHATADNQLTMIAPSGEVAYSYTKTMSWYPTRSDGILHVVETPYGRLSSAICFDMDFPALIQQAAQLKTDIMLVPAYDWEPIKPYHTEVGLFRAVENGFSIVRQVNEGTSMAVDYRGQLLAQQDFFTTAEPTMLVDVPTQGVATFYGGLGNWFVWVCGGLSVALLVLGLIRKR